MYNESRMTSETFRRARPLVVFGAMLAISLLGPAACTAQEKTPPPSSSSSPSTQDQQGPADKKDQKSTQTGMTRLKIRVTTDADKPVANASVYVRFNTSGGFLRHDKLAEMNFKTNQDGSVKVPEIPQGKVLIQVIATGWHTYGEWYDIDKDEDTITIKLAPPPHWY
jgi:hypothetical protein